MSLPTDLDVGGIIEDFEEDKDSNKSNLGPYLPFYNKRLGEIPCLRSTYLYSISAGLWTGIGTFLLTSNVRKSSNWGVGTFTSFGICYWFYCRYTTAARKFQADQVKYEIRQQLLHGKQVKDD